ncbi:hypothetical protein [Pseudovibrio sp. SPO723]|uniref:hypothetical protein n=1 Tax=Nesiotobacter zosterae TaxID=392721 RepID=UPI0029C138F1|nr:hypothetical protein [Pseudovibrio sp. SPO723]MDX5594608.1 hypothetical protein [Pseudovibrio sp. SPO723]
MTATSYFVLSLSALLAFTAASQAQDLLGKTLTHAWQEAKADGEAIEKRFETFFCETDKLVWNDVTEISAPKHGVASYTMTQISPDIAQLTWRGSPESQQLGYVWTLDFSQGKVYGVIINADADRNVTVEGTFEVLSGVTPTEGRQGCQ